MTLRIDDCLEGVDIDGQYRDIQVVLIGVLPLNKQTTDSRTPGQRQA